MSSADADYFPTSLSSLTFRLCTLLRFITCRGAIFRRYSHQDFTGAVAVEDFPWNDAVVVVDNEAPGESISLQPEEDVVQYGAGIVIMQTSWVSPVRFRSLCFCTRKNNGSVALASMEIFWLRTKSPGLHECGFSSAWTVDEQL